MYRPHNFTNVVQCYERTLNVLSKQDYKVDYVHNALTYLIDCKTLYEKGNKTLKENELFFVDIKED